jgi:metal-sulfur cluster biosynthetic enzyme
MFDFFGKKKKSEEEEQIERNRREQERQREMEKRMEEDNTKKSKLEEQIKNFKAEIESNKKNKKLIDSVFTKVIDPELNVDIWTLGLIYGVEHNSGLHIKMTFTSPMCPYGPMLLDDITKNLVKLGYKKKEIDLQVVFDPPWTPTQDLRDMLGV